MATIVKDLGNYFQAGEALAQNDAIYIDSGDNKIYKFDATDDSLVFAGIAKEAVALDDYVFVAQSGSVKGFVGLTAGAFVYASVTVPGSFQLVEPSPSQKVVLGIAKSSTELTINGGLGIKPGGDGGGGGLDAFYTENMEGLADTSDFSTGNNAAFMGGGTLQGDLDVESVSPISGAKSLKYTQAAGSLNDYFASDLIELDLKQQDNTSGMTFYFTYDGNDDDGKFVVYDVTNSIEISNQVSFVKLESGATRYSLAFYVPASCTQIRWGYQVLVENIGAVLLIDDVEMSTDPFHEAELISKRVYVKAAGNAGQVITANVTDIPFLEVDDGSGLWDGDSFTPATDGEYSFSYGLSFTTSVTGVAQAYLNGVAYKTVGDNVNATNRQGSFTINLLAGQVVSIRSTIGATLNNSTSVHYLEIVRIPSSTSHILTPSDTFSTDTAPLTYAGSATYTLATLANAPIGTFITFTYAINTNTRTQTNAAAPTQTTSDMNQNGILLYTRAYNAASTSAQPAAIAIQIGKGLKGRQLNLYKSAGKVTAGSLEYSAPSTTYERGATVKDYNEYTGVLIVDVGYKNYTTATVHDFLFSDISSQTSGYLTINAGKTLPLLAVPVPLVAYLKDVKTSGTTGGTFTSGAWQTRTLNTVEGDGSIVSLSANQFTLGPGKYEIEASAPAYKVNAHKSRLQNITTATTAIIGGNSYTVPSDAVATHSPLVGTLILTSPSVFEIQHQCSTTFATEGLGPASSFGVSEIYSIVKISKVG